MGELSVKQQAVWIKEIKQVGQHRLAITWNDDLTIIYSLAVLQSHCPCTKCRDSYGQKKIKMASARSIKSVGNYALSVVFTEGCSEGIYPYSLVKKLQGERM